MANEFYFGIAICMVSSVLYDLVKKVYRKRERIVKELESYAQN